MLKNGVYLYKSQIKQIQKELEKEQKSRIRDAAVYARKKVRSKIKKSNSSAPGTPPKSRSGDLRKGIKYKVYPEYAFVGATGPAHHAHLMEFGTDERFTKEGKSTGRVDKTAPRPFLFPTFLEEKETIKKKLAGVWVK
jgi:HK97 gp10 family phage protein